MAVVATTSSNPQVLVIGLDPRRVPGPWDPEPVVAAIESGMASLADHGFDAEACLVALDGSDDARDRVTLALGTRSWDCVVVGGGIRGAEDQLELFEAVVNLVRRHAPEAAIAFNRTPRDLADAVTRVLR